MVKAFKGGSQYVDNEPYKARSETVVYGAIIERVNEFILDNLRINVSYIISVMNISASSMHTIIFNKPHFSKDSSRVGLCFHQVNARVHVVKLTT